MSLYSILRPHLLFLITKAAWDGRLFAEQEKIFRTILHEYEDRLTRQQIINHLRAAMGFNPQNAEPKWSDIDLQLTEDRDGRPIVITDPQVCHNCYEHNCENKCPVGAITHDSKNRLILSHKHCLYEGNCLDFCPSAAFAEKSEIIKLIHLLQSDIPVYATIAPSFIGQFGKNMNFSRLRSALLALGFKDIVETAFAADFITIKETLEFVENINKKLSIMITSCCCPAWIKLIETKYPNLIPNISPSVSPMISSARLIKQQEPDAKVVFIGPCIAKKAEAKQPEFKNDIDIVLTFLELDTLFKATGIQMNIQTGLIYPSASASGRIYAKTGGVSEAVATTLARILPEMAHIFLPVQADGIPDCISLLNNITNNTTKANFVEGMACLGGCIGGPGKIVPVQKSKPLVDSFAAESPARTSVENHNVFKMLNTLQPNIEPDRAFKEYKSPISFLLSRKK